MKKFGFCLFCGIVVSLIVLFQFVSILTVPTVRAGFYCHIIDDGIYVQHVVKESPAWKAGLRNGDMIVCIDEIDVDDIYQKNTYSDIPVMMRLSGELFPSAGVFTVTVSAGAVYSVDIDSAQRFGPPGAVPLILKINLAVCFIYLCFGFLLCFAGYRGNGLFSFVLFLFSTGITIFNSCIISVFPLTYTAAGRVLFDIGCICSGSLLFVFLFSFFFRLFSSAVLRNILCVLFFLPVLLMAAKYSLLFAGVLDMYAPLSMYAVYVCLTFYVLCGTVGVVLLILNNAARNMTLLRFIFAGIAFGLFPLLISFVAILAPLRLVAGSDYPSLFIQLSVLFIPVSIFCGLIHSRRLEFDKLGSWQMFFGAYLVTAVMLFSIFLYIFPDLEFQHRTVAAVVFFAFAVGPPLYLYISRKLRSFLYPSVSSMQRELNELEDSIFLMDNENEVLMWVCDWIIEHLNAGFVQIVLVDSNGNYELLYGTERKPSADDIRFMKNQRRLSGHADNVMFHGIAGFSAPLFKNQHLWGYIFAGRKQDDSEYAGGEMNIIIPVCRILMKGLSFFESQQVEKEKEQLQSAFSRYLSPELVDEILVNPEMCRVGGEKRMMTALFTDLRDFSSLSEKLEPDKLVKVLNLYLNEMSAVIVSLGGTIDKFEGDAIMAFFGAPAVMADHALQACRAAVRIKKMEYILNEQIIREKLSPERFFTRIGINSGEMIVGNIGSINRLNYTIIGNEVNIAARIETVNKKYGTGILVSEQTWRLVNSEFSGRRLDSVKLKGVSRPVTVYALGDEKSEISAESQLSFSFFNQAMNFFGRKDFIRAANLFEKSYEHAKDNVTLYFIQRCREQIQQMEVS